MESTSSSEPGAIPKGAAEMEDSILLSNRHQTGGKNRSVLEPLSALNSL